MIALIRSDAFTRLPPAVQAQLIRSVEQSGRQSGGVLGRLLGTRPGNLAIHAVLVLCAGLLLLVFLDHIHAYRTRTTVNLELLNLVVPVITLSIGYIIGRGAP